MQHGDGRKKASPKVTVKGKAGAKVKAGDPSKRFKQKIRKTNFSQEIQLIALFVGHGDLPGGFVSYFQTKHMFYIKVRIWALQQASGVNTSPTKNPCFFSK